MAESHVLSALKQKRAAVAGEIIAIERRIGDLRAALVNLDGAMRLFADDINPKAVIPRLPRPAAASSADLPHGSMTRTVLDVLREAVGGMNLADIAGKVTAALGIDAQDSRERQILNERIRNTLYRVRDRGMAESSRDHGVIHWRLIG